eukprot:5854942-Pyramimonas_sp.AAC.1
MRRGMGFHGKKHGSYDTDFPEPWLLVPIAKQPGVHIMGRRFSWRSTRVHMKWGTCFCNEDKVSVSCHIKRHGLPS